MAGRPRTMLKRIREWEERADQLCTEILNVIPAQYLQHMFGQTNSQQSGKGCDAMADIWFDTYNSATSLTEILNELAQEIVERNARKGIRLEPEPAEIDNESATVTLEKGAGG